MGGFEVTEAQAIIWAALIAVVGGAASYIHQRHLDRKDANHREFRDWLHAYFEVSKEAEGHIFDTDGNVEFNVWAKYEASFYSLRVLAPADVVPAIDEHRRQLAEWHEKVAEGASDADLNAAEEALRASVSDLEAASRKVMSTGRAIDPYRAEKSRIAEEIEEP